MNRYIFHIPVRKVIVCAIYANSEKEAWKQVDTGICEQLYTRKGTTKSGKTELVMVQKDTLKRRET